MKKRIVVFAGNECRKEKEAYYYPLAYKTGKLLAEAGFVVVTGGGPGLMDKVCQGAYEAGGETIGVCLRISGRKDSEYLNKRYMFHSLIPRQTKLLSLGDGYLALPGGIGTLHEISVVLALKRKLEMSKEQPLVLVSSYYREFRILIEMMKNEGYIAENFDSLYTMVETPEESIEKLKDIL